MNGIMYARQIFNDRFSVSFMLALGIHAVALLGISFVLEINPIQKAAATLDVVLVNWRSESEPDEAEFLAQADQQGGGDFEEAEKPSQELSPDVPSIAEGDMPANSEELLPEPDTRRPSSSMYRAAMYELCEGSCSTCRHMPGRQRRVRAGRCVGV